LIMIGIIVLIAVGIFMIFSFGGTSYNQESIDEFAKCLTDKGAVMYGTFWCPHCAATKKKFGSSFSYIEYVECDPRGENEQSELCLDKKIDKYDTWEFSDGSRFLSEPSFEDLSGKTGCSVPEEK
jgi:glutaredoxin